MRGWAALWVIVEGMIITYQVKLPLIAMFTVSTVCALMVLMVECLTPRIG